MEIIGSKVVLRDFEESDILDHIVWNTKETEWKKWDTPWVRSSAFDQEAYREKMLKKCTQLKSEQMLRFSFEIDRREDGKHIGWMNAYTINQKYEACEGEGDLTIGIDLPLEQLRGNGYGKEAFALFRDYFRQQGYRDIYTQTWSGNERMIGLAQGLGFTLCHRKPRIWCVDGIYYDGLTFVY